jgi:hypothetical protein
MTASTAAVIAAGRTEPEEWPAAAVGSASCVTGAGAVPDGDGAAAAAPDGVGVADVGQGDAVGVGVCVGVRVGIGVGEVLRVGDGDGVVGVGVGVGVVQGVAVGEAVPDGCGVADGRVVLEPLAGEVDVPPELAPAGGLAPPPLPDPDPEPPDPEVLPTGVVLWARTVSGENVGRPWVPAMFVAPKIHRSTLPGLGW